MSEAPEVPETSPAAAAKVAEKPSNGRGRKVGVVVFLIILAAAAVGGVAYYMHARQYESTDDAFLEGNVVPVSAKVPGRVQDVLVDDNQEVTAGQALARIDPADYQARVDRAKATYDAAVAQLEVAKTAVDLTKANTAATLGQALAGVEQAKASVVAAKSQIDSAQADVAAAEAESALHDSELKRYESTDRSALTQMELDTARTLSSTSHSALTAARKRVGAAEANLVEAQARVTQRESAVDAAKTGPQQIATAEAQVRNAAAAVEEAKAAVNSAQLELSYTTIVAPWAGRVARKSVEPGQFLQAGQAMLALVGADVWVTANFKETQLTHMQAGQEVDIRVDAYPGKLLHGRVESIMGGTGARFSLLPPENATGNYVKVVQRLPVKIVFDWDSERHFLLAPGMSAEPRVHVGAGTMAHPAAICPTSRPAAK